VIDQNRPKPFGTPVRSRGLRVGRGFVLSDIPSDRWDGFFIGTGLFSFAISIFLLFKSPLK
jgi:hypothetical protein